MNEKVTQLKAIHDMKEQQLSLAFMRRAAEMELENKRELERLDLHYMKQLLTQRQLSLQQAQTIRGQFDQLIEYQTKLSELQVALAEHQNNLVACQARLAQNQAQLMHYQAQLLLHQTQFILLQTQLATVGVAQREEEINGELAAEAEELVRVQPEP